ncbi:MAG: serine hydrolase domain-containing protein [Pseudomonadota bacterium]
MIRAALIWLSLAAPVFAGPAEVEAAYERWLSERGGSGVLVQMQDGAVTARAGFGMDVDAPVPLASLSKAITAVCALTLVAEARWTIGTTAEGVLGYGGDVTVAEFMTHTSGLGPDATQGWRAGYLPIARALAPDVARKALERGVTNRGDFAYNNENYAVLGEMIAAETGQSYGDACAARALAPAGVSGDAAPRVAPMQAWGGWAMRVEDYAAFVHHWFAPDGLVGADLRNWPRHHFEGEGYWYGPGMFARPWRDGVNHWHFGSYCYPGQLNLGAFSVRLATGWSAVAGYDLCLEWEDMLALDQALTRAAAQGRGE